MALSSKAALTSQWSFDETSGNIASNSVSANNGTVSGGVTHVTGQVSKAYQFDGNSGAVNLGSNVGNFGTNDFSISYWMRVGTTRPTAVMEKRPYCNMDYGTSWWSIRGTTTFGIEMGGDHMLNQTGLGTTTALNDNQWHHVVWQRQGLTLRVFVDGALNASSPMPGPINLTNSAAMICGLSSCDYIDGTLPFAGALDELQLFNHALSAQEVKAMYDTVISNLPPDCATSLALAQAQLAGANATNEMLRAQLEDANASITNLQGELNAANAAYSLLQSQYNTANNWNTYYADQLTKIAQPVTLLSSNYAMQFNSPGFKVPGATLDLQISNIVYGIQTLDNGSQTKLFKLWTPKKTVSGF